jgi:hypothetical protein
MFGWAQFFKNATSLRFVKISFSEVWSIFFIATIPLISEVPTAKKTLPKPLAKNEKLGWVD